jgi:hypothetical protein
MICTASASTMHSSHLWMYNTADSSDIKVESEPDLSTLLSPPHSPFINSNTPASAASVNRRRSYSLASPKQRVRPYPLHKPLKADDTTMSGTSGYAYRATKTERRSSEGELAYYSPVSDAHHECRPYSHVALSIMQVSYSSGRPASRASSSLQNAMGADVASPSRFTSPSRNDVMMTMDPMPWTPQPTIDASSDPSLYPGVPGPYYNTDVNATYEPLPHHGSQSPQSPFAFAGTFPPTNSQPNQYASGSNFATQYSSPASASSAPPADEIRELRSTLTRMQRAREQDQARIQTLEAQLAYSNRSHPSSRGSSSSPPQSASFQASWKARTEARTKIFCSLNRAGNALCAWHDSRRERRMYSARNAPPGYLNCGCTYEEALFEESLARHQVGSYLPGESVRMDPALRNPLLKLLQERYGYRDGDFERNPRTGEWLPGEGPLKWEQVHREGITNPRRPRPNSGEHGR